VGLLIARAWPKWTLLLPSSVGPLYLRRRFVVSRARLLSTYVSRPSSADGMNHDMLAHQTRAESPWNAHVGERVYLGPSYVLELFVRTDGTLSSTRARRLVNSVVGSTVQHALGPVALDSHLARPSPAPDP
jgi:hypothetical protein